MRKLRAVWASPLRPQLSGISAYSEDLLGRLHQELDLTVLFDGGAPAPEIAALPVRLLPVREFPGFYARHPQDVPIYHMGNNAGFHDWIWSLMGRWRGLTVSHDSCYHHFFLDHHRRLYRPEAYLEDMLVYHGVAGYEAGRKILRALDSPVVEDLRGPMHQFSLLGKIMDRSNRVAVHNEYARKEAERVSGRPVELIPMNFVPAAGYLPRGSVPPERFGAPRGAALIISLGYVTAQKRLDRVIAALALLAREGADFRLVIAGQTATDLPHPLQKLAKDAGLADRVRELGHVSEAQMYELLAAADFAVNLRYPTAGESSAALIRLLGAGVPTLVTDHGSLAEFPDEVVCKIPHDNREIPALAEAMRSMLARPDEREALGRRAQAYVLRENHIDRAVARYLEVIEATRADQARQMIVRAARAELPALEPLRGLAAYSRIAALTAIRRDLQEVPLPGVVISAPGGEAAPPRQPQRRVRSGVMGAARRVAAAWRHRLMRRR